MNAHSPPASDTLPAPLIIASPWRRLAALGYDILVLAAVSFAYGAVLTALGGGVSRDFSPTVGGLGVTLGWVALLMAFYVYFWRKSGQTIGMRTWRMRLVTASGARPGLRQCLLRALLGACGLAVAGAGYVWCLFDRAGDSAPDRLTGLHTVVEPKAGSPQPGTGGGPN